MNNCKVCGREVRARELCSNHYTQLMRYGKVLSGKPCPCRIKNKKCFIGNCDREHFAKGYCRSHYDLFRRNGTPYKKRAIRQHLPLGNNNKHALKGERNPRWNGGTSDYPNHYLMKKNRLIILMQNPKCEICSNPATEVHHRDGSKNNHDLSNLMASCHKCNSRIRFKHNQSKYSKIYGMNFMEMARNFGHSHSYYHYLHKKGKLKEHLDVIKSGEVKLPISNTAPKHKHGTPNPYRFKLYRFRKSYKLNVEKLSRIYKVPKEDIYLWIYNKVKTYDMKLEPLYREFIGIRDNNLQKEPQCPLVKA